MYDAEFRAAYPGIPEQLLDGLAFKHLAGSSNSLELLGRYEQRQASTARRADRQLLEIRNQRQAIHILPNETIPETGHKPAPLETLAATASSFNEIAPCWKPIGKYCRTKPLPKPDTLSKAGMPFSKTGRVVPVALRDRDRGRPDGGDGRERFPAADALRLDSQAERPLPEPEADFDEQE